MQLLTLYVAILMSVRFLYVFLIMRLVNKNYSSFELCSQLAYKGLITLYGLYANVVNVRTINYSTSKRINLWQSQPLHLKLAIECIWPTYFLLKSLMCRVCSLIVVMFSCGMVCLANIINSFNLNSHESQVRIISYF